MLLKKPSEATKLKCLVYGASGTGKTFFAGSSFATPTLVISAEAGTSCLSGKQHIDVFDITRDDEDATLVDRAQRIARLKVVLAALQKGELTHPIVVLDSLSEIAQNVEEYLSSKPASKTDGFAMWREYKTMMTNIVKAFRDLDRIVVMTSLATEKQDESTGMDVIRPAVAGSVGAQIASFFDVVAYLRVNGDGKRELLTNATPKIVAKDRSGKLAPVVVDARIDFIAYPEGKPIVSICAGEIDPTKIPLRTPEQKAKYEGEPNA